MRTRTLLLGCVLAALTSMSSSAQIQRLIIPEANVQISPGSSAVVSTFCTDLGIVGPHQNQSYGHVLTSSSSARVLIGGKEMSLSDAITTGQVELKTPRPTIESAVENQRHFNELDPSHAVDLAQYRSTLERLSPADRAKRLLNEQNPSALQIVNHSGQPMTFVAHNAAVGTADSPAPLIPLPATGQNNLWTAQIQEQLVRYGYKTPVDGTVGPDTRAALLAFQKKHNLHETGTPTTGVAKTLRRIEADNWLRSLPKGQYTVARLDDVGDEPVQYHLVSADGAVAYHGNLPDQLISSLFDMAKASGDAGKTVYLEAPGLSEKEKTNLRLSLSMASPDGKVVLLPTPEESPIFRESFFRKGARFDAIESESQEDLISAHKGWFHSIVTFIVSAGNQFKTVTMDVWTRTQAGMLIVLDTFRGVSSPERALQTSLADIVAKSQSNLLAAGYTKKSLSIQLRDGTKRYVATLHDLAIPMEERGL